MLRPIAIAVALTLCSLSGSSSARAGSVLGTIEKSPTIRAFFQKKFYSYENGKFILVHPIEAPLPWGHYKRSEFDLKGWGPPTWAAGAAAYACHHWKTWC
jgi:hypothetical protein